MSLRLMSMLVVFTLASSIYNSLAGYESVEASHVSTSAPPSDVRADSLLVLSPGVRVFLDGSNVGVITRNGRALLIGSGDTRVLEAAPDLGIEHIDWVLYTHHAREQVAGVHQLKRAGVAVAVPAGETRFFERAADFWRNVDRRLEHRYTFRPDFAVLRESVEVDRQLQPGTVFEWQGIDIHVVGTPGRSDGAVSYVFGLDGHTFAFTGDLIYGPGQIRDFYGLQKRLPGMPLDYWGFGGAVPEVIASLRSVLAHSPDVIVPSHGVVIREPAEAVALLERRLEQSMRNYFSLAGWRIFGRDTPIPFDAPMLQPLPAVDLPSWIHRGAGTSWYLKADDGSVFLFDAGAPETVTEFDRLQREGAVSRIEAIWLSHYHDDHVESANWFRFMHGAWVYAQQELVDVLENPRAYSLPALPSQAVRVDHALREGETIQWKDFTLTGYFFPGQTLHHGALLIEHQGTRVLHVGDSFNNWGIEDHTSHNRNLLGPGLGYERCLELVLDLEPDLLLASHWGALPVSAEHVRRTLDLLGDRRQLYEAILPWEDVNFGLDPYWVRTYPYRQTVLPGSLVTLEVRVHNHANVSHDAYVELRLPPGWQAQQGSASLSIPGKTEGAIRLMALAPLDPSEKNDVVGVWVRFGDRSLGEVTEGIVEYFSPCCPAQ